MTIFTSAIEDGRHPLRRRRGQGDAGRHPRPAPPPPDRPEADRLPLSSGGVQCGTGLRRLGLAAGGSDGGVLPGGVTTVPNSDEESM